MIVVDKRCLRPKPHLSLHKMAAILADDYLKCIFLNENDRISIRMSLKFIPRSLIDNKLALVLAMSWRLFEVTFNAQITVLDIQGQGFFH